MKVFTSTSPPDLQRLPLTPIGKEWFGAPVHPPPLFGFGLDSDSFYFLAKHQHPATCHPDSRSGKFQAELWRFDVAEFFLTDPVSGHYLEFNLAPNGGWWSCQFSGPLQRCSEIDQPLPGVRTAAESSPTGWTASATVPRFWLEKNLHFGPDARLNATFILYSPKQRFLTASSLGEGDPAFHRPASFPPITFAPNPA